MWGLANEMTLDARDSSMGLVRGARRGSRAATRSILALALMLVAVGCAGKKRPFGEAVPGDDGTEDFINSEGDFPGATPTPSGMGGANDEDQGLAPLDQEGPPGVGEVLPGDAVGGEASAPCDDDAGSCVSTDDPSNTSECVPTGPRDCTSDVDNDCDGQPDNVLDNVCVCLPESISPCDEHPGLDGRGQCRAGTRTCILGEGNSSSDWGACDGSVGPGERDSCSVAGDDTDCDGINNGGCPCIEGEMRPCGPDTEDGICQRGTQSCVNGTFGQCVGAVFRASRNCSSNQDNDCDGRPDNSVDNVCTCTIGSLQACGTHPGRDGNGQCQAGSQRCEGRGNNTTSTFGTCTGSVGPALQDTCVNGNDGNCNDIPNEGCACVNGQTRGCGPDTDVGSCQRGTQTCVNGSFGGCQGAVFPAPRNCASAQDNDCDGRPDNTLDEVCGTVTLATSAAPADPIGTMLIGSTIVPMRWVIINEGSVPTGPLTLTRNFNANEFVVESACLGQPLNAGNTCTLNITFTPQRPAGTRNVTFTVTAGSASLSTTLAPITVRVGVAGDCTLGASGECAAGLFCQSWFLDQDLDGYGGEERFGGAPSKSTCSNQPNRGAPAPVVITDARGEIALPYRPATLAGDCCDLPSLFQGNSIESLPSDVNPGIMMSSTRPAVACPEPNDFNCDGVAVCGSIPVAPGRTCL
jgi:hypothetical protein